MKTLDGKRGRSHRKRLMRAKRNKEDQEANDFLFDNHRTRKRKHLESTKLEGITLDGRNETPSVVFFFSSCS